MARQQLALIASLLFALGVSATVDAAVSFRHGVSCGLGTPESNSIFTWLSVDEGATVGDASPNSEVTVSLEWQVATTKTFEGPAAAIVANGRTDAATIHLGSSTSGGVRAHALVSGLQPQQRYFYRFRVLPDGPVSPVGSFITPSGKQGDMQHVAAEVDDTFGSSRHVISASSGMLGRNRRSAQQGTGVVSFQLLHINDMHNHIEALQPSGQSCTEADENNPGVICIGGFARLATYIKQQRSKGVPTLVLDGGDQSTGTLWDVYYRDHEPTAVAQKQIGFDAMTLGQHEFDNGIGSLLNYVNSLSPNIPVLGACNIDFSLEPSMAGKVKRWVVVDIAGAKVGVLGFHTTDTAFMESSGRVRFNEVVPSMQQCVADFKAANPAVKIIIGLSSAGYLTDQQVAANVPGLSVIVGGHSHTFLWGSTGLEMGPLTNASNPASGEMSMGPYPTYVTGPSGGQVAIVHAGHWSKYVGTLNLTFTADGALVSAEGQPALLGGPVSVNPVARDPAMLATIKQYKPAVDALVGRPVGVLANALSGDRTITRLQESPLGNLVCDSLLWLMQTSSGYDPQICLINSGTMRTGLNAGNVTSGDLLAMLPFGNSITIKDITGLALLTALENGVASDFASNELRGAFPQVGGIRFTFNSSAPKNARVHSVQVRGADGSYSPVDLCATYRLVTHDYVGRGGDGYSSIKAATTVYEQGPGIISAVAVYIAKISPVTSYAATQGRLNRCNPTGTNPAVCSTPRTAFGSCPINFTLLHYNDAHAHIGGETIEAIPCTEQDEATGICNGGMSRLTSAVKAVRATGVHTLVLDAGDVSVGSAWDIVYPDRKPMASLQNAAGVNAFTLGNHEFDYGLTSLADYLKMVSMPVLACNIDTSTLNPTLATIIKRYTVLELGTSGVRAGIIGWITPTTANISRGASTVRFLPVLQSVKDAVAALKAEYANKINIFIGLSHGGSASDREVATWVGDIDLIVSGHDHILMYGKYGNETTGRLDRDVPSSSFKSQGPYPTVVTSTAAQRKRVPIVQVHYALHFLGNLALSFDASGNLVSWSGQPMLLGGDRSDNPIPREIGTLQAVASLMPALNVLSTTANGRNPGAVLSGDPSLLRTREAPLGSLVCDAMMWYLNYTRLPPAQFCIYDSGSIVGSLPQGDLTMQDAFNAVPYADLMVTLSLTGAQVVQALENAVSSNLSSDGSTLVPNMRFAQVAGLRYWYNPSLPVGKRVLVVQERTRAGAWIAIRPCGLYTVVTTDYLSVGNEGYSVFTKARRLGDFDVPNYIALIAYLRENNPLPLVAGNRIKTCPGSIGCTTTRKVTDTCSAVFVPWAGAN